MKLPDQVFSFCADYFSYAHFFGSFRRPCCREVHKIDTGYYLYNGGDQQQDIQERRIHHFCHFHFIASSSNE